MLPELPNLLLAQATQPNVHRVIWWARTFCCVCFTTFSVTAIVFSSIPSVLPNRTILLSLAGYSAKRPREGRPPQAAWNSKSPVPSLKRLVPQNKIYDVRDGLSFKLPGPRFRAAPPTPTGRTQTDGPDEDLLYARRSSRQGDEQQAPQFEFVSAKGATEVLTPFYY